MNPRTLPCPGCDVPLDQVERTAGIWRPVVCAACLSAPESAKLVPVHCPSCRGRALDAIVCKIDERTIRVVAQEEPADIQLQCPCGAAIGLRAVIRTPALAPVTAAA